MPMDEFSFQTRAMFSWAVVAELLNRGIDLSVAELHPGGGQYDCLSLVNDDVYFMLNRNGYSANIEGEIVADIWRSACISPGKLANSLIRHSHAPNTAEPNLFKNFAVAALGGFLAHSPKKNIQVHWGWFDSSGWGLGPCDLPETVLPNHWKQNSDDQEPHFWQRDIWWATIDREIQFIVNLELGQAVDSRGIPLSLDKYVVWDNEVPHSAIGLHVVPIGEAGLGFQDYFQPFTDRRPAQKAASEHGYKVSQRLVYDPEFTDMFRADLPLLWLAASGSNSKTIEEYLE